MQPNANPVPPKEPTIKPYFTLGIIVTEFNLEDINYYSDEFKKMNAKYKQKLKLVFFGYTPEKDTIGALDGVIYSYVKPVSIIHYFKQLQALQLDMLFVPLINNRRNIENENYNKFLEAALFKIPTLVVNIYPYNQLIQNDYSGFIYESKETFEQHFFKLMNAPLFNIQQCGTNANEIALQQFNYSHENVELLTRDFN